MNPPRQPRPARTALPSAIAGLGLLLTGCTEPTTNSPLNNLGQHHVYRVVDGDTIRVSDATGTDLGRVRLIGIDAPELGRSGTLDECHAGEATQALATLIEGQTVTLLGDPTQTERDRYDRLLAYVELDGIDVGHELVAGGDVAATPHPHSRQNAYAAAHEQARATGTGIWDCD